MREKSGIWSVGRFWIKQITVGTEHKITKKLIFFLIYHL